jgi:hypothetical protein
LKTCIFIEVVSGPARRFMTIREQDVMDRTISSGTREKMICLNVDLCAMMLIVVALANGVLFKKTGQLKFILQLPSIERRMLSVVVVELAGNKIFRLQ